MAPKIIVIGTICESFAIDLPGKTEFRNGDGLDFYGIQDLAKLHALRGPASR
jgi:hypothetical protein